MIVEKPFLTSTPLLDRSVILGSSLRNRPHTRPVSVRSLNRSATNLARITTQNRSKIHPTIRTNPALRLIERSKDRLRTLLRCSSSRNILNTPLRQRNKRLHRIDIVVVKHRPLPQHLKKRIESIASLFLIHRSELNKRSTNLSPRLPNRTAISIPAIKQNRGQRLTNANSSHQRRLSRTLWPRPHGAAVNPLAGQGVNSIIVENKISLLRCQNKRLVVCPVRHREHIAHPLQHLIP